MNTDEYEYSCSVCNTVVGEDDKFCPNCGADLGEVQYDNSPVDEDKLNSSIECFYSLNSKSNILIALLSFLILINVISLFASLSQLLLIQKAIDGFDITDSEAAANDIRILIITIFQIVIFITTSIIFLFWENRAFKNLSPLGSIGLNYSSGWAVGAYFVPILGLFRPFQIMREIWKASDPDFISDGNNGDVSWKDSPSHFLLPLWWTLFLTESFFGQLSIRMSRDLNSLSQIFNYSFILVISDFIEIPSAIILILLVKNISKRQEAKKDKLFQINAIHNSLSSFS